MNAASLESGKGSPAAWRVSDVLADLEREGDGEFVRELIDAFLRDSAVRLESMRRAASSADLGALAAASHALKGSALLMSADRLAQLGADLERRSSAGETWDYAALVDELEGAFAETRAAMISYERALTK